MIRMIDGVATHLRSARGRRRALLSLSAGLLGALALPPLDLWPFLVPAFTMLVWLLDGALCGNGAFRVRRMRAGAGVLFMFGLGWFGASVWWVGEAFLVDAERFLWLMVPAVAAMTLTLAVFWGLAGAIVGCLWPCGSGRRLFVLAAALALAEMLRGHFLGGFPWNLPAHALNGIPLLLQTGRLAGVYGLSFLAVAWSALPALLADGPAGRGRPYVGMVILLTLLAALVFGTWRLLETPSGRMIAVRIVQPNVDQREKWKPANREPIFRKLLELTARPGREGFMPQVIVWPESAVPFLLDENPRALAMIADVLRPGQVLLTGAIRRAAPRGPDSRRLYNSLLVIDDRGRIIGRYDKRRLVPFGEYLPLAGVLEPLGIRRLVSLPGGFLEGRNESPLDLPGLPPAGALICYEAIFPQLGMSFGKGAKWLVNVTNDAWFGRSSGPWQHLAAARLTAIVTGRPLVRAANTGISAAIDEKGRILNYLLLMRDGIIDLHLMVDSHALPLFAPGDGAILFLLLVVLFLAGKDALKKPDAG